MSDTLQIVFGLWGIIGGTSGLVGAVLVWRGRRQDRPLGRA